MREVVFFLCMFTKLISGLDIPEDFKFGAATAAFQVEGGWNASGKGESIWDHLSHVYPDRIAGKTNADVACDSYHLWKEDVRILKETNMDFYRFSLSWPRILPDGFNNKINPDGVRYYNDLINELIANGIEPMVTLYHWDLPTPIMNLGGWANTKTADYFNDYATVAFELFGDRVKKWITVNEPWSFCLGTYEWNWAPGDNLTSMGIGPYMCGKTVVLGHAKVWHTYDEKFRKTQNGIVGITTNSGWVRPNSDDPKDIKAAERELAFTLGWVINPIFSTEGNWPKEMIEAVAERSKLENFTESRLPAFTTEEIEYVKGAGDFIGLNHYNSYNASDATIEISTPSYNNDKSMQAYGGQYVGLRDILNHIKEKYNDPLIYVTENGASDKSGVLNDTVKVDYLRKYITSAVLARQDGVNIKGYTVWALLDTFEWTGGLEYKFGLYKVDFDSPNRTRTARASAEFYRDVITSRKIGE